MDTPVRTRFCLAAGASLPIEAARVALFNWLVARRAGGQLRLRVLDTHDGGASGEGAERAIGDLRWLGLDWDEGPQQLGGRVGGYDEYYKRLIDGGASYFTFDTPEELARMRREAEAAWRVFRYQRPGRFASEGEVEQARRGRRPVVLRFKMPGCDVTIEDAVLGSVTIGAEELDDFVIRGADGRPARLFAEVVDDGELGITHVIRGQEDLPWAHRQAALGEALGFGRPAYAHLPLILGADGRVLPRQVDVGGLRAAGYLPEGVVEFLGRLGWAGPVGRLTREDLIERFEVREVSRSAARFDGERLLELNAKAIAEASEDRLLAGLRDCLSLSDTPVKAADEATLRRLLRLVPAARTLGEIEQKCRVLFVDDEQVVYDEGAVKRVLARGDPNGFEVIEIVRGRLAGLAGWDAGGVERSIEQIGRETGLTVARLARVVRVAVTGRVGDLPVGLMLEVLGRDRTLRRMERQARRGEDEEKGSDGEADTLD